MFSSHREKYELTIKTNARHVKTGTDETVQVKITGENGNSTDWKTLDYFFEDDFEAGATREYKVHHCGDPVGKPIILTFRLHGSNKDKNWMVDHVVVEYEHKKYDFPIYKWVENGEVSITLGNAQLPQDVSNELVRELRASEIRQNREDLRWNPKASTPSDLGWGITRFLYVDPAKGIPRMFRKNLGQVDRDVESKSLQAGINAGLAMFKAPNQIQKLEEYKLLYANTPYGDPPFINEWKDDAEFGRQVMTGISPLAFKRCNKLPDYCNITEKDVEGSLGGKTLSSEMATGRIYIADYSEVAEIERNPIPMTNHLFQAANCIALFHSTTDGKFMPIAIQLVPGNAEYVFTPADSEHDWLLAKMYFRTTQSDVHEWLYHFFLTHGISETFCVATFRSLPHCHPIYKLLRPHLVSVVAINEGARKTLIPPGALANQAISLTALGTIRHYYKNFNISDTVVPNNIKSRGVEDCNLLKNYYYRDDALAIWSVVLDYVQHVIRVFYHCDEQVKADFELQGWASDLANEGFGWQDGNTRGVPDKIESIEELIRLCTIIIFSSSAQHAAVNFGQLETYQFVPNAPGSMVMPPHKKGEGSLQRILSSLPGPQLGAILVTFAYALSMYAEDEVYLGDFVEHLFIEKEVQQIQHHFKQELNKLNKKFSERNKSLKYPYWYLLPEKIPTDINI